MNLIEEYFKRDLTETEEQELAVWLESHPEDSVRFAQMMKSFYEQTGLPEPAWPHSPDPTQVSAPLVKWLIPLVLLFMAFGVYLCRSKITALFQPSSAPVIETAPAPSIEVPVQKQNPIQEEVPVPTSIPEETPVKKPLPVPTPFPNNPKPVAILPLLPIPPLAPLPTARPTEPVSTGRIYERLSVMVNLPQGGLATVRVVDSQDNDIRLLYAGILPAGQQTFTWDGKTAQGALAPPGHYFVEIKSGADVLRQEIHLQQDSSAH